MREVYPEYFIRVQCLQLGFVEDYRKVILLSQLDFTSLIHFLEEHRVASLIDRLLYIGALLILVPSIILPLLIPIVILVHTTTVEVTHYF